MSEIQIRRASAEDWREIVAMNCELARETEGKELDATTVSAGVRRGLELPDDVRYLLAVQDTAIIGQLMLTREWSDWRNGWIAWLQSVYVHPTARRRGAFRALLNEAVAASRARPDIVALRLYVENTNHVAQETYRRSGFADSGYHVLEMALRRDGGDAG